MAVRLVQPEKVLDSMVSKLLSAAILIVSRLMQLLKASEAMRVTVEGTIYEEFVWAGGYKISVV